MNITARTTKTLANPPGPVVPSAILRPDPEPMDTANSASNNNGTKLGEKIQVNGRKEQEKQPGDNNNGNDSDDSEDYSDSDSDDDDDGSDDPGDPDDDPDTVVDEDAPPRDWREGKTIPQLLKFIFEHDEVDTGQDVTFLVGPEETPLKAHKRFLAFRSRTFDSIFYPNFEESDLVSREPIVIPLPSNNPRIFHLLLRYIYVGLKQAEIDALELDDAVELMGLSAMYGLPDLDRRCGSRIRIEVDKTTAAVLLDKVLPMQGIGASIIKDLCLTIIYT